MQTTAPVGAHSAPSLQTLIAESLRDAVPLAKAPRVPYTVLLVLAAIAALTTLGMAPEYRVMAVQIPSILGAVALFFAIATVIRTVEPGFRMTFGKVIMFIAVSIAVGIVTEIGMLFLIVPGLYLLGRWYFAPLASLIDPGNNPFGTSWNLTRGMIWHTVLLVIAVAIVAALILILPFIVLAFAAQAIAISAVIFAPIALAAYIYALTFGYLCMVRWYVALRERARVALPPSGLTPATA